MTTMPAASRGGKAASTVTVFTGPTTTSGRAAASSRAACSADSRVSPASRTSTSTSAPLSRPLVLYSSMAINTPLRMAMPLSAERPVISPRMPMRTGAGVELFHNTNPPAVRAATTAPTATHAMALTPDFMRFLFDALAAIRGTAPRSSGGRSDSPAPRRSPAPSPGGPRFRSRPLRPRWSSPTHGPAQ